MSIPLPFICVGVAMWYLAWKKSAIWGLKGLLLGGALYVVLAWAIPFAFKVLTTVIPMVLAIVVIAAVVGLGVFVGNQVVKHARR